MRNKLHSVVLAGGRGARLRAFTRTLTGEEAPKQFCRFGRARSLLQRTLDRIATVGSTRDAVVVVPAAYADVAREQVRLHGATVVPQTLDRGTGPGLLLPLTCVLARDPEAIVLITPADHGVDDQAGFADGVRQAQAAIARNVATVVVCGVTPDQPRSDYGWIVPGPAVDPGLRRVARFVEKPDAAEAQRLFESGALWSTMVLVARAHSVLDLFWTARPDWAQAMEQATLLEGAARERLVARTYKTLAGCDFSQDVLPRARDLTVQAWPPAIGWSDLGTPERLQDWLAHRGLAGQPTLG